MTYPMATVQDVMDCAALIALHPLANADEIRAASALLANPSVVSDFISNIPADSPEVIPAWYVASRFIYLLINKTDTIRVYTALYPDKEDLIVSGGKVKLALVSPIATNFKIPDLPVSEPDGSLPWAIDWNITDTSAGKGESISAEFHACAVFRNMSDTCIANPTIH